MIGQLVLLLYSHLQNLYKEIELCIRAQKATQNKSRDSKILSKLLKLSRCKYFAQFKHASPLGLDERGVRSLFFNFFKSNKENKSRT